MKTFFLGVAATLAALGASAHGELTTRYKINTTASSVTWEATKVTGEHSGTIQIANGFLSSTDGNLEAANVIVDMQSIACTNLEGEWADKLVGHLNSEDFFHVNEHRTSSFTLRNIQPNKNADGQSTHDVTGDFTIRGITQSVTFPATISESNKSLDISGTVVLNRAEFEVKYGSGSFFDNLGDNLIHDNFTVNFHLVAEGL